MSSDSHQRSGASHITVSKVLKPRGLRGELKCMAFLTETDKIFIDDVEHRVVKISTQGDFTYLFLDGINTIEKAERFRNKSIEIEREAVVLADDEVLAVDLIGFDVVDVDGNVLGKLQAIENYGASDIFDCGTFSFPNEDTFVIETNMIDKKIVVQENALCI